MKANRLMEEIVVKLKGALPAYFESLGKENIAEIGKDHFRLNFEHDIRMKENPDYEELVKEQNKLRESKPMAKRAMMEVPEKVEEFGDNGVRLRVEFVPEELVRMRQILQIPDFKTDRWMIFIDVSATDKKVEKEIEKTIKEIIEK